MMIKNLNTISLYTLMIFIFADKALSSEQSDGVKMAEKIAKKMNATISTLPPLVFPGKNSNYTIIPPDAATIRRLQHMTSKETTSRPKPEFQKVLSNRQGVVLFRVKNMDIDNVPDVFPSDPDELNEMSEPKEDVEEIQEEDVIKKQVGYEEQFGIKKNGIAEIFNEDIEVHNLNFNNHHLTIILATFLGLICLAAYIALLLWRHYLKKRYGMRQLLVTHDDYYHNNDARPFNDDFTSKTQLKEVA